MRLTFVFATAMEADGLLSFLKKKANEPQPYQFRMANARIDVLITGIGLTQCALTLGLYLSRHQPDLLVQAGIAGSFSESLNIGDVVQVVSERFGDLGVEEADASFSDWHDLGWTDAFPATSVHGVLHNLEGAQNDFLPKVKGISVNKVTGSEQSISVLVKKYPTVEVESMEGAAFFSACLQTGRKFLQLRAISNKVEPRNKENWDIPLALKNLNSVLLDMVQSLTESGQD